MARWYVRHAGKTFGPLDGTTVLQALTRGEIVIGDECRHEEVAAWTPLSAVPEVAEALRVSQALRPANPSPHEALGSLALVVPFVSTLLVWFWIGGMRRFEDPGGKLVMLAFVTIVLSSLLAAIEAGQLGFGGPMDVDAKGRRRSGPFVWFLFMLLMWIVAFPAYMARRSTYRAKNMILGGIVVAATFSGSVALMHQAIYR